MLINKIKTGLFIVFIAMIAISLTACGQNQSQPETDNSSSSTIVISPEMVNLEREKSIQFTAIIKDNDGNTIEATPAWEVIGDIGEITASGLFTAKKIGSGSVKASYGERSVAASMTVTEVGAISMFGISRLWLSPNNDGVMDSDLLGFSLPNKRRVSLKLCKLSGEIVGTIYDEEAQGEINWFWYGKIIESSSVAADGEYLIKLLVDGEEVSNTLRVNVDCTGPVISLLLDQSVISPNGDGIKDSLTIDYSISDLSATTEIEAALKKDNHFIYGLQNYDNCPSNVNNRIVWGGKLDSSVVCNGKYVVWIRSTDKAGNKSIATKEVVVDADLPAVSSSIAVSNPSFSPNNDGVKDRTDITFSLLGDYSVVTLNVLITNDGGTTVRELIKNMVVGNEEQVVTWDGKADNGLIVANGDYSYKIMLEDEGGNKNSYSGPITVDR